MYPALDRSGTLAAFSSPIESDKSVASTSPIESDKSVASTSPIESDKSVASTIQTSALRSQVSGLSPQVSALRSQSSGLSPQVSVLSPQVSALSSQPSGLSPQVSENYACGQDVPTTNCGVVRIVRAFGLRVHGPFSMRSISSFAASRPIL